MIACCRTVFTKEQRLAYKDVWEKLESRRLAIRELDNGIQYRFPGDPETLRLIQEWVSMERLCCPFLTFAVKAGHVNEPVYLELTGNEETKSFLRSEMQSNIDLITKQA